MSMFTKVLTIDGQEVGFRASALTPRLYRARFGRDIVRDLNQLRSSYNKAMKARSLTPPGTDAAEDEKERYQEELQDAQLSVLDLEIFENAAYIMAKQYDQTIPRTIEDWLDGFQVFSIYEILPSILELWNLNNETTAMSKKK